MCADKCDALYECGYSFVLSLLLSLYFEFLGVFCFKQKTAYEMRISDWSSDVCSSDLAGDRIDEQLHREADAGPGNAAIGQDRTFVRGDRVGLAAIGGKRSEKRRVGKESVSTCRSRWSLYR